MDYVRREYETRGGKRESVEIDSPQKARDLANNKALPLSNAEREDLRRVADKLEEGRK